MAQHVRSYSIQTRIAADYSAPVRAEARDGAPANRRERNSGLHPRYIAQKGDGGVRKHADASAGFRLRQDSGPPFGVYLRPLEVEHFANAPPGQRRETHGRDRGRPNSTRDGCVERSAKIPKFAVRQPPFALAVGWAFEPNAGIRRHHLALERIGIDAAKKPDGPSRRTSAAGALCPPRDDGLHEAAHVLPCHPRRRQRAEKGDDVCSRHAAVESERPRTDGRTAPGEGHPKFSVQHVALDEPSDCEPAPCYLPRSGRVTAPRDIPAHLTRGHPCLGNRDRAGNAEPNPTLLAVRPIPDREHRRPGLSPSTKARAVGIPQRRVRRHSPNQFFCQPNPLRHSSDPI